MIGKKPVQVQRNWGTSRSEDLRRLSALVQARAT
jgi:hypothetical protein